MPLSSHECFKASGCGQGGAAALERALLRADILVRINESDAALANFTTRGSFEALKRSLVVLDATLLSVLFKAETTLLGPHTGGNSCRDLKGLILGFLGEKPAGRKARSY